MAPKNKGPKKAPQPKTFDASALASLTAKIENKLGGDNKPAESKKEAAPKPNNNEQGGKRKREDGPADTEAAVKVPRNKRRATQEIPPQPKTKTPSATLLAEIKALGGDEDDLELVADLDSDAEDGGGAPKTKDADDVDDAFKSELAKFAASLGLDELRPADEGDEEEEEEEGEPEEEEAGEDIDEGLDDVEEEEEEEAEPEPVPVKQTREERRLAKQYGSTIIEPRADWHAIELPELPTTVHDDTPKHTTSVNNLKAYAKTLLEEDSAKYQASQASTSTSKFMSQIMSGGTLSDKVSAYTLALAESPLHNFRAMESLITLAGKKSRGQAIAALGALVDLLGNGVVLPADRRLRTFQTQPGLLGTLSARSALNWTNGQNLPGRITKAHLIIWAYEDWLKDAYFRIIQLLEVWCGDEIDYSRTRALDFVFGLLKEKPEQESNLLRLVVNKLGDRDRKIASRASYLLLQLLTHHPGMKAVMIKTIEHEVLLKPGASMRSQYYAINTLNQTILSTKEPAIADNLLRIYFEMFLTLLKSGSLGNLEGLEQGHGKKGKKDNSKKFKHAKQKGKPAVDGDEKPAAKGPKPAATETNEPDETQKLVASVLTGVNRAIPFATADDNTLEKHLDTLFRICHSSNFSTAVQALMLIQQLASSKHLAVERYYRVLYESLLDSRLITSSKQSLYLNLLFRSLKNDVDVRRVKAFVKRMLQVINLHNVSFACGILYLVAELQTTFPDLKTLLTEPEYHGEDDEEVFQDADKATLDTERADQIKAAANKQPVYDGRKRDPEYSNADKSCLWELVPFLKSFHPSVSVFAQNILTKQKSLPKPELANHTLMHFLDKFVYRNPKAVDTKRGGSIMQPTAGGAAASIVVPGKAGSTTRSSVNTASFWNLKQDQVAAEDVFFHEYFSQIGKPSQTAKKAKKEVDEGASEDEEAEEEIWDALVNSRPELNGADEEDADVDMDGFSDEDDISLNLDDMSSDDEDDEDMEGDGGAALDDGSDGGFEGIFGGSDDEAGGEWEDEKDGEHEDEDKEEKEDEDAGKSKKWKERRARKKEMKSLPMFASADDYAEMLARDDDLDDPNL